MAEGAAESAQHSMVRLVRPAAQLSPGSDMSGSLVSTRPKDPDDRTGSGPGASCLRNQAPAVPKPGSSAPAPVTPLLLGFRTPRRFPIGVFLVRFSIGLATLSPLPCLRSLFLLIHLFRYRLRALHLGSACRHCVRAVRRPRGPSPARVTVRAWRPSGHTRQRT